MGLRFLSRTFVFFLLPTVLSAAGIAYKVDFEGLEDSHTLKEMRLVSHLTSLQKRHPSSINALKYRADSDIPSLIKVLQANGYYEGKVTTQILEGYSDVTVIVRINPGPQYNLGSFEIELSCPSGAPICCKISLEEIGIRLHKPMLTETILQAELKTLQKLAECGYPLAKVEDREVIVDGQTKDVKIKLQIKTEEKVYFGPSSVTGAKKVKPEWIEKKIKWHQGEPYDSSLVDTTQTALINTNLFSSVLITHEQTPSSNGELPMKIDVTETKHQSVNIGVSYQTVFGPGLTFGWENKNIGGMGRTLSFQGDITRISQTGVASYIHPEFYRSDQNMIVQGEAAHEDIYAYSMRSYSLMDRFERIVTRRLRGSLAFQLDRLFVTASAQNGNYWLFALPIYLRWSSSNSLLNPTRGATVEYTTTPALNSADVNNFYLTQELVGSVYTRFGDNERIILAQKFTLGVAISNGLGAIPLCNRFLGGTETDLRGYRYKTVSPLSSDGKPLGGRSALYYSFETRLRVTQVLGLVPFFDMGNVYLSEWPTLHSKWRKSVGLGFRFFTFMGPFRIDLAFPLDPRKKIDPRYKILASIGQMF